MARDDRYHLSNEERVTILAASNTGEDFTSDSKRLSEQNQIKFGTNRLSEIKGVITDSQEPFEKLYNDYLLSL